jgi:hypothetical protein
VKTDILLPHGPIRVFLVVGATPLGRSCVASGSASRIFFDYSVKDILIFSKDLSVDLIGACGILGQNPSAASREL